MKIKLSRRGFAGGAVSAAVLAAVFGGAYFAVGRNKIDKKHIRPPGAVAENKFLSLCVKCGQCVQVCPYGTIELLDMDSGLSSGTPAVNPEKRGCYLCDLLPCVLACPSGALDHNVSDAKDVKMCEVKVAAPSACLGARGETASADAVARLAAHGSETREEKELAAKLLTYAGKKCAICVDLCPYPEKEKAIRFEETPEGYYPEILSGCAGCGACAELCPAEAEVFVCVVR